MAITTEMIKALREVTSAGVLDCKKALETTDGDFDKAVAYLREKGLAAAAKKASREANDGLVHVLVDAPGRVGAIVEVNCETDFVARTADFKAFVEALVRQVSQTAGIREVPDLLTQPFGDDQSITVAERLTQLVAKLGENMVLRRFGRIQRDGSGLVEGYVHPGSRIGVLVHVTANSEATAQQTAFRELVHDLALQIAAAAPQYISASDIPTSVLEAQKADFWAQLVAENKPEHIKERIVSGKLDKWYEQVCLLHQPFIKDDELRVEDLIQQKSRELGTTLSVKQFIRYELGAGQ